MAKKRKLIDHTEWVKLNGDKQNIRVYTYDKKAPVLLFLHGGPGVCDRHWVLHYQKKLAENYSVDLYKEDAKRLIDYLCKKFKKDKIVVFGHSWGTVLGTPVCYEYPDHIAAYIGQGQVVNGEMNEDLSYKFVMEEAAKVASPSAAPTP